ncbi:MAG: hypothetical protein J0G33_02895 [Afipia felis]|nr:hypothetical protein [Afipia felis]
MTLPRKAIEATPEDFDETLELIEQLIKAGKDDCLTSEEIIGNVTTALRIPRTAALAVEGMVIVPKEPSYEMLCAIGPVKHFDKWGLSPKKFDALLDEAKLKYRAMLSAYGGEDSPPQEGT